MRNAKNITLCVSPAINRQTRHLAADYDSTVSGIVAWLLERPPAALERAQFPKAGPTPPPPSPPPLPPTGYSLPPVSARFPHANFNCETVTPPLTQALPKACGCPTNAITAPVQLYTGHSTSGSTRIPGTTTYSLVPTPSLPNSFAV